ncbi:MAG: deoxyribose-phosphate aldolase [Ignavibacteria bacterium]|jgi:deoxyribose-phosphate aldolase
MKKLSKILSSFKFKIDESRINEKINSIISKTLSNEERINYLKLAVSIIDLTTLEGSDTKDKVVTMCKKAIKPLGKIDFPYCAAICIYPNLIKYAKKTVKGSKVKVASVATAFPSGQFPLKLKLLDVKYCIEEGAREIDMVISRGEFLSGNYDYVFDEIKKVKKVCTNTKKKKPAHLKVILETGELGSLENVWKASFIAMLAGADFIKTSTGKIPVAATLPVVYVMCEAIKFFYQKTGVKIGIKAAGGIRTAKDAIEYILLVKEILGEEWLTQKLFRIGASSLLNDLLKEYKELNSKS